MAIAPMIDGACVRRGGLLWPGRSLDALQKFARNFAAWSGKNR
jgi:hypothetical protein